MKKILERLNIKDEELFILFILAFLINLIYFIWRVAFTIDYSASIPELIWPFTLLTAETYSFLVFVMFAFATINNRKIDTHLKPKDINYFPSVDIFICTYNESKDILHDTVLGSRNVNYRDQKDKKVCLLEKILRCKSINYENKDDEKACIRDAILSCKNIRYKNKKVYLLDDGNREEMKYLAEETGINYISRESNKGFKAGNINNAIKQTDGEFIVIFDADHVPVSTFLLEVVDFLKDENVALVQTPQYFLNPDPFQKNLKLIDKLTNEQELFFRVLQPGLEQWNSVICSGTNFIIRRSALLDVGCFPEESVTEDMDLGMRLFGKGYFIKYYNKPLAAGLAPETFQEYVNQRLRWCTGNLQSLIFNWKKSFKHLSPIQKTLCISGISYYFFGFPRIIFLLSPMLYLLFGIKPLFAYLPEVGAFIIACYTIKIHYFNKIAKKYRNFVFTDIYETSIAFYLSLTVIKTFINPHNIKFKITSKGIQQSQTNPMLFLPHLIFLAGAAAAFIVPIYQLYKHIFSLDALILNMLFNFYNMILLIYSVRAALEKPEQRKEQRIKVDLKASLENTQQRKIDIEVINLSKKGALLFSRRDKSDEFESILNNENNLLLPNTSKVGIEVVKNYKSGKGRYYNVKFNIDSKEKEDEILKVAYKNSINWT